MAQSFIISKTHASLSNVLQYFICMANKVWYQAEKIQLQDALFLLANLKYPLLLLLAQATCMGITTDDQVSDKAVHNTWRKALVILQKPMDHVMFILSKVLHVSLLKSLSPSNGRSSILYFASGGRHLGTLRRGGEGQKELVNTLVSTAIRRFLCLDFFNPFINGNMQKTD